MSESRSDADGHIPGFRSKFFPKVFLDRYRRIPADRFATASNFLLRWQASKAAPVSRANRTGSMPAYQAQDQRLANHESCVPANASQSFKAGAGSPTQPSFKALTVSIRHQDEGAHSGNRWNDLCWSGKNIVTRACGGNGKHCKCGGVVADSAVIVVLALLFSATSA